MYCKFFGQIFGLCYLSRYFVFLNVLSGGFSVGWPVAGMGMVTDPDRFGMFGTLDPNVLHTPKGFGFEAITGELRPFL